MSYTTIRTQSLAVADASKAQRGFLKQVVDYVEGKGTVKTETLVKRFAGKKTASKNGNKASTERVVRYAYYAVRHGILRQVAA
jgi:hypothetical protein